MNTILSYQRFIPTGPVNYLSDTDWLVGSYKTDELLEDGIKYPRAYKSAAEWFVNAPLDTVENIRVFTEKYGLLRWNFTHEGQGGGPGDQFYIPVTAFRESQREFQKHWGMAEGRPGVVTQWLNEQFAPTSKVTEVQSPDEMWKLSQPKISVTVTSGMKGRPGLIVRLTLGDLWQELCYGLLEVVTRKEGFLRACQEKERCREKPYFVTRNERKIFCCHDCAKRRSNRIDMQRRRARLRRKKTSSPQNGK